MTGGMTAWVRKFIVKELSEMSARRHIVTTGIALMLLKSWITLVIMHFLCNL
jgi:hypothetical protein